MAKSKVLTEENVTNGLIFLLTALIIALVLIVGKVDHEDQMIQDKHYCDMAALWEADRRSGVVAHERAGWPPFKGYCDGDSGK